MEQSKVMEVVGTLYIRNAMLEEQIKRLQLALQAKDDEIGLLRTNEREQTRISTK